MNSYISCCYSVGGSQIIDKGWVLNDVLAPDNQLYIVEKGEIEVDFNGETMQVKGGEMLFIPSLTYHCLRLTSTNHAKITYIRFNLKSGAKDFFCDYKRPIKILLPNKNYAVKIMQEVIKNSALEEPNRSLLTSSKIFELVSILISESEPYAQSETKSYINKAVSYIDANFTEQLSLNALAEKFGCSPNHFIRKFKDKTGYTPIKYLSAKKIEVAKKLIENTSLSISDVMEKVGFYDASYFSKLFKKTVGCSPREYRDNLTR